MNWKQWLWIIARVSALLVVAFGITEAVVPAGWDTIIQAIVALVVAIFQRRAAPPA